MNKMLQYHETDENDNIKVVRVYPADAVKQMKDYAHQHGYSYADSYEAIQEFIALHWAYWVEE